MEPGNTRTVMVLCSYRLTSTNPKPAFPQLERFQWSSTYQMKKQYVC